MIKIGVFGSTGRMGQVVIKNVLEDANVSLGAVHVEVGNVEVPKDVLKTDDLSEFLKAVDVVIDFSLPIGTQSLLEETLKSNPKPIVCAVTGLNSHQENLIDEASTMMPVLHATNMSLGVALLNKLTKIASASLNDFDVEIVEQHHRYKKDSPSGTAMTLATNAASARGLDIEKVRVSGRNGDIGARSKDEIGVMSLRGGDIVGRHTVGFYNDGEFIELYHQATSRDTFAKGAIRAAKWLAKQDNALYGIDDCLGL